MWSFLNGFALLVYIRVNGGWAYVFVRTDSTGWVSFSSGYRRDP